MAVDHRAQPDDLSWDPYDYALHADSQPVWRRMREEAPLYRNDEFDFWALTRFDDVLEALVDHQTYSSAQGDILEIIRAGQSEYTDSMISEDPPLHTVHRQDAESRLYTPCDQERRGPRPRLRPSSCSTNRSGRVGSTSSMTSVPECRAW